MHCIAKPTGSPLPLFVKPLACLVLGLPAAPLLADAQPDPAVGPAQQPDAQQPAEEEGWRFEPVVQYDEAGNPVDPCRRFDAQFQSWLDRSRAGLYRTVCGTAAWFDGFFGDSRYDEKTGDTYGRISLGGFYDRRDDFDERIRLRASFAFPAMRERGSVFIAQGDEDNFVEERGREAREEGPAALNTSEDTELFAGFGFDKSRTLERGFSLRVGARLRTPVETFAKARYRYAWRLSENNLFRVRPVLYWRSEERIGATLGLELDNYLSDSMLLRWSNFGNVSQDPEINGMRWGSTVTLFHALSDRRALTYSTFVRGETEDEVKLQNFGVETRFRHRFLRDWLFVEYVGSLSWPREVLSEDREINPGFGVRFEAHFGPTPVNKLR